MSKMRKAPKARASRGRVIRGKKPPKSGVKGSTKTPMQKMLEKWPPKV